MIRYLPISNLPLSFSDPFYFLLLPTIIGKNHHLPYLNRSRFYNPINLTLPNNYVISGKFKLNSPNGTLIQRGGGTGPLKPRQPDDHYKMWIIRVPNPAESESGR